MNPRDEGKTTSKLSMDFMWLVMTFDSTNVPSIFMSLMNHIFKDFHVKFVVVYFDDILIFSSSLEEHVELLRLVFEGEQLYVNLAKYKFCVYKVIFLGFIVTSNGVECVTEVRSFHGLDSFHKRFVKNFSKIVVPLPEVIKRIRNPLPHVRVYCYQLIGSCKDH
uniref:Reverse transcriptase domain-containing protein n=1 Tax=Solanum lycopersicum TaxID=4081 RepID=A0A3Q7JLM9_SOLLC